MSRRVLLDVDNAAGAMGVFRWWLLYHLDERVRAVPLFLPNDHRRGVPRSNLDALSVPMSFTAAAGDLSLLSLSRNDDDHQSVWEWMSLAMERLLVDQSPE